MLFFLRRLTASAFFCFLPALAIYIYDLYESTEKGIDGGHAQIGYVIADLVPQTVPHLQDPALIHLMKQEAFSSLLFSGGVLFGLCFMVISIRHIKSRPDRLGRGSVYSRAFDRKDKGIKYKRKNA